ncbi:YbaB/EbfC family nucleoid-associated protein [Candidatus Saccharibacteria bacterium]|nr:YbaB/EbfC family nucleoid-associated protein [Candidatus Saccharibacteria bacterium]
MAMDQMKMLNQLRKAQKDLGKEIIEVVAGDNDEVVMQFTGELKIKSVEIKPEFLSPENAEDLNHYIEICIRDGLAKAQEVAAEKMKPLMGGLGNLPF